MDNSINQEAIADNNASVNNNLPVNPPILNDATNPNPPSINDSQSQVFNGGGIHKMKKHLAQITGDVKKCPKVPYDVEKQIKSLLKEIQTNKNKRKVSFSEEGGDEIEDEIDEAIAQEEQQRTSSQQVVIHEVDKWFAQWLLDCKIPFNAVILPFFQDMLDCVADASSIIKNASHLYILFSEVIEWIHSNDIVHVVTDNVANYIAAGRLINKKYDNIIKGPNWREIVRPGATRFATVFIILKSIFERKVDLLVDANDKPSLGYVYEGMLKADDAIKEMFKQNKTAYQLYIDIINSRWDKHLKKDLHAYNNLDSIEAMKELHLYRDRKESFDRPEAIRAASKLKLGKNI
ncbi:uncharacterized protein LOC130934329 [Arachis stenosperma]|uniref:uncharacterized protein LOC130934329 n=1 Tax=Arachis stenosperma TaxID=217475 RepID=UPI0025AD7634|nr:uncharacterized protein LOC130934329 [Arachis stenosperma]